MMNSTLVFLVIFSCVHQELVDGTPMFDKLQGFFSRIFSRNKLNSDQGYEADNSNFGNDNLESSITLDSVSNAELGVDSLPEDVVDYEKFLRTIKENVSQDDPESEKRIRAEQIEAMLNKIHEAQGNTVPVEFGGKSTNVFVGEKGSQKRKKSEKETTDCWVLVRGVVSKTWKWIKKNIFCCEDDNEPKESSPANNHIPSERTSLDSKIIQPKNLEGKKLPNSTERFKDQLHDQKDSSQMEERNCELTEKSTSVTEGVEEEKSRRNGSGSPPSHHQPPNDDGYIPLEKYDPVRGYQRVEGGGEEAKLISSTSDDRGDVNPVGSQSEAVHVAEEMKDRNTLTDTASKPSLEPAPAAHSDTLPVTDNSDGREISETLKTTVNNGEPVVQPQETKTVTQPSDTAGSIDSQSQPPTITSTETPRIVQPSSVSSKATSPEIPYPLPPLSISDQRLDNNPDVKQWPSENIKTEVKEPKAVDAPVTLEVYVPRNQPSAILSSHFSVPRPPLRGKLTIGDGETTDVTLSYDKVGSTYRVNEKYENPHEKR